MATTSKQKPINTNYELFIMALSVLSIFNLIVEFLPIDPYVQNLVVIFDWAITPIFLGDFCYRLFSAPSKVGYFFKGGGWLDFIGSLPFPALRLARLFRMWRVYRVMRRVGMRNMWAAYRKSRAESALLTVIFLTIVVLEFASIFVLVTEKNSPNANIKTASDALWWAYVTVTTVGYGDEYPVTNSGRVVGVLLMTIGVGLFGVITGYLANAFLKPKSAEQDELEVVNVSQDTLQVGLQEIKRIIVEQEQYTALLKKRLETIEGLLQEGVK
ncbi:MAG: ion transporter [Ktedonobacteraceae bacterium]